MVVTRLQEIKFGDDQSRRSNSGRSTVWIHGFTSSAELGRADYFNRTPSVQRLDGSRQFQFRYGCDADIDVLGRELAECCRNQLVGHRLQIRAHSMGGLVFASALLCDPSLFLRVDNGVFYDCPFLGVDSGVFEALFGCCAEGLAPDSESTVARILDVGLRMALAAGSM